MAKWRVEKSREPVDGVAPWKVKHPMGFIYCFSTWNIAMSYVDIRTMKYD